MAGELLTWIVLEGIVGTKTLRYKLIFLFSDNRAAVSWTQRGAAENSAATGRLIIVIALWQRVERESPLVAEHVAGDLNVLGNIPSPSFGYSKQYHCTNDSEFLSLINFKLPLSHQRSWQGFLLSFALIMKLISELGTKASTMGEWKQLWKIGESFGGSGVPIANPL